MSSCLLEFRVVKLLATTLFLAGLAGKTLLAQDGATDKPFVHPLFSDHIDHVGGGLVVKGGRLEGFVLAGADRRFVWADARIDGNDVLVASPQVPEPKFLRYDYVDVPRYRLWNQAGLPAAPFETRIGP